MRLNRVYVVEHFVTAEDSVSVKVDPTNRYFLTLPHMLDLPGHLQIIRHGTRFMKVLKVTCEGSRPSGHQ